ncbi:MAG: hypothetical protein OQL08_04895 [Gammaproteobacteria bacterium]|nr:hypothetical protein [Gammaproteobacteria bacterium]
MHDDISVTPTPCSCWYRDHHAQDAGLELGGKHIFIILYPHYAEAMALTGDGDIVCCAHEHRPAISEIKNINKGNVSAAQSRHSGRHGIARAAS